MTRFILAITLILSIVSFAWPQAPDLGGKTLAETFAKLLPEMSATDSGKRNAAQQKWQDICFQLGAPKNEKLRTEAAVLMADSLDPKTPNAARLWLLAQLERIGREESVETIAKVLDDKDDVLRDAATRALANNPSPKATGKLTAKLSGASTKAKIGLLNALGHRGDPAGEGEVAQELKSKEVDVAVAAARAMGRIAGSSSMKLLAAARGEAKGRVRAEIGSALLAHADRMVTEKDIGNARALYALLNTSEEPRPVRLAALRGVIQTAGDKGGEIVLKILGEKDNAARDVAIGQIENLSAGALKPLAASMDKLPVPSRVAVITAIAARGDRTQLPVALAAAKGEDAIVRRAGVLALGRLGDASVVEFLLGVMTSKDPLAGTAVESLAALSAEGVNEKLIKTLEDEKDGGRAAALIGILERRKTNKAAPAFLKRASENNAQTRTAAFAALKTLGAPEHLPGMVAALDKTEKGKDREQAEVAIAAVAQQITNVEKRAETVLAALKDDTKRTGDLLPLLGRLGGAEALKVIRKSVTDNALHDSAITALCNWPDGSANDDLLSLAEKGKTQQEKQRAIGAIVRINGVLSERSVDERLVTVKVLTAAMKLAERDEERRAILEGLGNVRHIEALRFVVSYLDQPSLAQSACKGVVELAHSRMLREPNREEFAKALDRVIGLCKDKGLIERAKQYKAGQ